MSTENENVQIEYTDANGLQLKVAVPMTEERLLDLVRPLAAETTLLAVRALLASDADVSVNEAFRYATYLVLVQAYGREFVRDEFKIALRTDQRWHSIVRDAVDRLADDADAQTVAALTRVNAAYQRQRERERVGGEQ